MGGRGCRVPITSRKDESMNFVTANFRGQRVARCSWAAAGGCTLRAGVAAKGVCRWFVSEDEINSAVGFIAARRKRPRRKGTNVNKFKSDRSVGPTVSWKTPREFFIRPRSPMSSCLSQVFPYVVRPWDTALYTVRERISKLFNLSSSIADLCL